LWIDFCIGLRRVSRASMRKVCGGQAGLGRKWRAGRVSSVGSLGPRVSSTEAGCEAAAARGAQHAGTHRRRRPTAPCDGPARPAPTSRLGDPSAQAVSCLRLQLPLNVTTKLLVCRSDASASGLVRWGVVHRGQLGGALRSAQRAVATLRGHIWRVGGQESTGGRELASPARSRWRVGDTTPRSRADDSADLRLSADDLGSWGRFADRRASLGFSADDHSSWGRDCR
jgi:hypothetical protein